MMAPTSGINLGKNILPLRLSEPKRDKKGSQKKARAFGAASLNRMASSSHKTLP